MHVSMCACMYLMEENLGGEKMLVNLVKDHKFAKVTPANYSHG